MKTKYLAIYIVADEYIVIQNADQIKGIRPEFIYIFGRPKTEEQIDIEWAVVSAAIAERVEIYRVPGL